MADETLIPLSQARAQNRVVFFRYLSILCVVGLVVVGYLAFHSLDTKTSPCAENLASPECVARFCVSVQNAGYPLSRSCKALLHKVNSGKLNPGPGAGGAGSQPNLNDRPLLGPNGQPPQSGSTCCGNVPPSGGGGGSGGNGTTPGPAPGGGGSGTTPTPPTTTTKAPVNVTVPPVQLPQTCTPLLTLNC